MPPWQVPLLQVSPVVQRLLSLHGTPLGPFWVTQRPVAGTQTLTLQGSVLAGHVLGEPAWHRPLWQVSPTVQRFPSSHTVPLGAFCVTQSPVAGLQTLTLQGSVLAGQVFCGPPRQTPFWHVSSVQRLLSLSHGVPSGLNLFSGHWLEVPVQNSGTSHWFAAGRHMVVSGRNGLSGHVAELPEHSDGPAHGPCDSRQIVPAGKNSFSGHWLEVPVQNSGTSHGPAASRHTDVSGSSGFSGH